MREKCSYSEFFWSFFSRIRYVYEIYWSKSRFSMRMRKNTDQKRLRIWKLFTDDLFSNLCNWFINSSQALVNYLVRKENCPLFSSQFEMSQKMFLRSLWWLPILVKLHACLGTLLKNNTKADVFIICFETFQSAMKKNWTWK